MAKNINKPVKVNPADMQAEYSGAASLVTVVDGAVADIKASIARIESAGQTGGLQGRKGDEFVELFKSLLKPINEAVALLEGIKKVTNATLAAADNIQRSDNGISAVQGDINRVTNAAAAAKTGK